MDKKNNSGKADSEIVSEMIANLRKKYNSSSRNGADTEKKAVNDAAAGSSVSPTLKVEEKPSADDVKVAEVVPDKKSAVEKSDKNSFDGILYKGEGAPKTKPKKKYGSYRSEAPLFIFDSFDEDDEEFVGSDTVVEKIPKAVEKVTEAEETTEVAEAEETTEAAEVEETTEAAEVEETTEVAEAEEITEVAEAEETTEVTEAEETTEVTEAEKTAEEENVSEHVEVKRPFVFDEDTLYGEYKPLELINEDGDFKVIKAIDKNGEYKIVIVQIDDSGEYEILDSFDVAGRDVPSEEDDNTELDEGEAVSVAEELHDGGENFGREDTLDVGEISVAEELSDGELNVTEDTFEEESTSEDGQDSADGFEADDADGGYGESDEPAVADELESYDGDAYGEEYSDEDDEPIIATEIEEAVSIAEEYVSANPLFDRSKNHFLNDEGLFEDEDEPLTVATEIEDISLATEITSTIVLPGEKGDESEDETEIDPDFQDESFLRECAQLELPKILVSVKPLDSPDVEGGADFVNSGYEYAELPIIDAYIMDKVNKKRDAARGKTAASEDAATETPKDEATLRAEFYGKRANAHRSRCAIKARDAMKSVIYTAILAVIILFFENIGRFSDAQVVGAGRAVMMLVFDIALIFVGGIIIRQSLKESLSALLKFRYTCESVGILALAVSAVYGVFAALTYSGEGEIPFIGVPMIFCILYSAALRYIAVKRDEALFDASCDEGEYCTLAELERNAAVPEFKEFDGILGENAGIYRPNYPKRTEGGYLLEGSSVDVGAFGVVVAVIGLLLSAVAGAVRYFAGGSVIEAVSTSVTSLTFSLPVFLSVSAFVENSTLLKRTAHSGALILDKNAVSSIKNGAVLLINDTDMFRSGDVKIVGFDVIGGERNDLEVQTALGRVVSVVRSLGGSLSELFAQLGEGIEVEEDVTLTDISENGISAYSEGASIRVGSASYLGKYGISATAGGVELKDGEVMLYAAENGSVCLWMVLSYKANKSLCKRIDQLRGYGVTVSLKTCDPCIDTEMVMRTTGIEPELLRVVKYAIEDPRENNDGERDGGVVSTHGVEGLVSALGNCARHGVSLNRLKIVSAILSLAMPIVLTVAAALSMPFVAVPVWTVGLYYGGSALLGWLLAKLL